MDSYTRPPANTSIDIHANAAHKLNVGGGTCMCGTDIRNDLKVGYTYVASAVQLLCQGERCAADS